MMRESGNVIIVTEGYPVEKALYSDILEGVAPEGDTGGRVQEARK